MWKSDNNFTLDLLKYIVYIRIRKEEKVIKVRKIKVNKLPSGVNYIKVKINK